MSSAPLYIALLILQPFRHCTYVTTHSPTLPSICLHYSSFSNPSSTSLRHSSFSNPSFASPTSQALHLLHLASRPWYFSAFVLLNCIRRRGVVGRVPAFQPGGPGSIPGGVRNFNVCPGIGCVFFVCVLSCVVFGEGPDIVLTRQSGRLASVYLSSVLVHRQLLPLQASDPRAFGL